MNRGTGPQHEETGKRRQVFNQVTRNTITSPVLFCTPHDYLVNFLSQKKQVVVKIRSNKLMLIMMRSRFCLSCLDVMDNLLELLFSFSGRVVLNTNPSATIGFFSLCLQMTGLLEKSSHEADQIITIVRDFQAFIHRHSYYYIVGSQNRGIAEAVDVLGNKFLILTTVLTTKVIPCKL